jgi:hypothetical protein
MAGVAQLLAAGMPLRYVSVSTESVFDTHNDQAPRLTAGLGAAAQTVYAFQRDLEARDLADRVRPRCGQSSAVALRRRALPVSEGV